MQGGGLPPPGPSRSSSRSLQRSLVPISGGSAAPAAPSDTELSSAETRRARAAAPPPGNTGTHWTLPSEYLLAAATRANVVTARRHPLEANGESLAVALQRFVHHEGSRPPNRQILMHLRLLTLYPPVPDVLADMVLLLEFENVHVCRLAHYHVRAAAPISDPALYRDLCEALTREAARPSPARRAAATKTLAKVFVPSDVNRAIDFVTDVFNRIGGARVQDPATVQQKRKVAGVAIPGTDVNKEEKDGGRKADAGGEKKKEGLGARMRRRPDLLGGGKILRDGAEAADEDDGAIGAGASKSSSNFEDDGAGGVMASNVRASAQFIRSRFGKMLVGHAVFAALRRINRIAADSCRVEAYFFDSGLMSVVPSTVRHCVALLEIRSSRSPVQVSKYISSRLPHRNPAPHKQLLLDDLAAKVYFARMLGALAEDPDLAAYIPRKDPNPSRHARSRRVGTSRSNGGLNTQAAAAARSQALAGETVKEKAGSLFKFLFNKERVAELSSSVVSASSALVAASSATITAARGKQSRVIDPRGVEFAEALVNLLKNASNRVLLEALRSLSHRRWTTWYEAPIPQSALYNSPELADPAAMEDAAVGWGIDGEETDNDDDDDDDEKELGAYEDDVAKNGETTAAGTSGNTGGKGAAASGDGVDPDLVDTTAREKNTWAARQRAKRKEKRVARVHSKTPFYLRKVGAGMVPALEVVLRRMYHAMLHDEAVRRFAAADAIVVLARAKLYGHSKEEQRNLREARASRTEHEPGGVFISRATPSSSRAVVVKDTANDPMGMDGGDHPFEPLVGQLRELMNDDPNQYVRGRAAVALAFVLAAGAGAGAQDAGNDYDSDPGEDNLAGTSSSKALMVRYFRTFVTREGAGRGVGLRLVSEMIDYLVYELLDLAPDLGPSAVELAELWAVTHPTIGVCGRLGALWEKVLSLGMGGVVGASIFRAMTVTPHAERVASAAAAFLRRRTLDLAVLTVGASHLQGSAVPEPLPRAIGMEIEKYFSLLWHSALLGPSAECRTLSIEALGGAAVLAGDPLRVCTYERLVELVRVRGLGLKIPAENVMDCLDVLYFSRERFSEARHQNRIARDGSNRSSAWLQIVWRLAAESSSAAQILLGVPPPTGWQPLGPSGAADVANAEAKYGDVRDRQFTEKLKDSRIIGQAAPRETPTLAIEDASAGSEESGTSKFASGALYGYAPKNFARSASAGPSSSSSRGGRHDDGRRRGDDYDEDDDSLGRFGRLRLSDERSRDSHGSRRSYDKYDNFGGDGGRRRASDFNDDRERRHAGRAGRSGEGGGRYAEDAELDELGFHSGSDSGSSRRLRLAAAGAGARDAITSASRRATESMTRREQEERDAALARRLQRQEGGAVGGARRLFGDDKVLAAAGAAGQASGSAAKLLRGGLKSTGGAASRAGKLAKSLVNKGPP